MSTVIKIENLSKSYRLGEVGTGTISHDLNRFWAKIMGKEDPYAIVGSVNDRTKAAIKGEVVNALSDINLEIKQGEVLGIIGKNGAGKSTLLKILSRITTPTTGSFKIKGRMASLLEVGTGFHPEMTGRENVYMNGTIMGMRKREIDSRLDEIVEFAGVAKYLDTPVKRYSSGMTVRLGFSVAAHLDSEILVVDEVLAVGDAEFQKKAIGKMQDVSTGQGRTVLFVSHNMGSVSTLTNRAIIMERGQCVFDADTPLAIEEYLNRNIHVNNNWKCVDENKKPIQLKEIKLIDGKGNIKTDFEDRNTLTVEINYVVREPILSTNISVNITNHEGVHVLCLEDIDTFNFMTEKRNPGKYKTRVDIPIDILNRGSYYLRVGTGISGKEVFEVIEGFKFTLIQTQSHVLRGHRGGLIIPKVDWQLEETK